MSQSKKDSVYYSEYLQLDAILNAQFPESTRLGIQAHDEMLFIITHQAFELWFKQVMFELESVIELLGKKPVSEQEISLCVHRIRRINEIILMTMNHFSVLESMTALDFMDFRDLLHPASGFQSVLFRVLEIRLGLKRDNRMNKAFLTALKEEHRNAILEAETKPTLFGALESWLENTPFLETEKYTFWQEYKNAVMATFDKDRADIAAHDILTPEEKIIRYDSIDQAINSFNALFDEISYQELISKGERSLSHKGTMAAMFINLYRDYPLLQQPNSLLQQISHLDENFSLWRYRHATMTIKMIGARIGTGGSSGFHYLAQTALKQRIFFDITSLAGMLIPRRITPQLPEDIAHQLRFTFEIQ